MTRLLSIIAVLKPFSSRYALSALRSASASSPVSVRILQFVLKSQDTLFHGDIDSELLISVCICERNSSSLSVMHIIGRRLSGNQDQNLVRQPNRFLRSRTNAEHSHKQVAIDNPEPPRAACGLMRSKPHRRRTEPVLAGDYVGYL
jgi:hypothetical protein